MANIERMSITLPNELANLVHDAVASGDYASNSEIIRDALRTWREQRDLKAIKSSIAESRVDIAAGRLKPAEDMLDRLERKYKNMR